MASFVLIPASPLPESYVSQTYFTLPKRGESSQGEKHERKGGWKEERKQARTWEGKAGATRKQNLFLKDVVIKTDPGRRTRFLKPLKGGTKNVVIIKKQNTDNLTAQDFNSFPTNLLNSARKRVMIFYLSWQTAFCVIIQVYKKMNVWNLCDQSLGVNMGEKTKIFANGHHRGNLQTYWSRKIRNRRIGRWSEETKPYSLATNVYTRHFGIVKMR